MIGRAGIASHVGMEMQSVSKENEERIRQNEKNTKKRSSKITIVEPAWTSNTFPQSAASQRRLQNRNSGGETACTSRKRIIKLHHDTKFDEMGFLFLARPKARPQCISIESSCQGKPRICP